MDEPRSPRAYANGLPSQLSLGKTRRQRTILVFIGLAILAFLAAWFLTAGSETGSGVMLAEGATAQDSAHPGEGAGNMGQDSAAAATAAGSSEAPPAPSESVSASAPATHIAVYISGAVAKPGVVELPANARLIDAVTLCGGLAKDAVPEYVNLAGLLVDGGHVHIPSRADLKSPEQRQLLSSQGLLAAAPVANDSAAAVNTAAAVTASSGSGSNTSSSLGSKPTIPTFPLNINNADAQALEQVPGIGPVTAKRIIDYRSQHGSFKKLEDLKKVSGIGDKRYKDMQSYLSCR
ncbi:MAG: helix-hairpin-helix domain-containing protein [Actinomycetia bacterium]|nr:helix-hairpin-helix domain-containing protein [Actinomycetes bacterium]